MLKEKVKATIEKYKMLERGDGVVVAVSGGPDSTALLFLLNSLRRTLSLQLYVAHLNHMLRGTESAKDTDFAEGLAHRLKLPFHYGEVNVRSHARRMKVAVEEAARNLRYEFLARIAGEVGAKRMAVGHTRDDQVETVLMRIIRGTGLLGLSGIPPTRRFKRYLIIRPLIESWRQEVEAYLKKKGLPIREDSSNLEPVYSRNKLRLKLLPLLEREYNPKIKRNLANMAESLGADYKYITAAADEAFSRAKRAEKDGSLSINLKKASAYPSTIRKRLFRRAIEEIGAGLGRMSFCHWQRLEAITPDKRRLTLEFPGGLRVRKEGERLYFFNEAITYGDERLRK